jgi:hypothetical protein
MERPKNLIELLMKLPRASWAAFSTSDGNVIAQCTTIEELLAPIEGKWGRTSDH